MLDEAKLNRILQTLPDERLAIAFSGGGDSTALVHICKHLRPAPLVLIVDHALRTGSAQEAKDAQKFSQSLGLETNLLTWDHDDPKTGLQEKARRARYGLMGKICREKNIRYLLTGHTQDDQAETLLMRYEKGTGWRGAAGMAKRTYAPVWPELAKITLVRPLMDITRQALRDYNRAHELGWAEDPSNRNPVFDRVWARQYLSKRPGLTRQLLSDAKALQMGLAEEQKRLSKYGVKVSDNGIVTGPRNMPPRLIELCVLAASGSSGPLEKEKNLKLSQSIKHDNFSKANLGGALCMKMDGHLIFGPDPSFWKGRHGQKPSTEITLEKNQQVIWAGRFHITAHQAAKVLPSMKPDGAYQRDNMDMAKHLKTTPGAYRGSMPLLWHYDGVFTGLGAADNEYVSCKSLVNERLNGLLSLSV